MTDEMKIKAYNRLRKGMRKLHEMEKHTSDEIAEIERALQVAAIYLGVFSIRTECKRQCVKPGERADKHAVYPT